MLSVRSAYFTLVLSALASGLFGQPAAAGTIEQVAQASGGTASGGVLPALPPALLNQLQQMAPQLQQQQQPQSTQSDDNGPIPPAAEARPQPQDEQTQRSVTGRRTAPADPGPAVMESDLSARAGTPLRLFGHNAFNAGEDTAPSTGMIQDSYILGFGDEIEVNVRGQSSQAMRGHVGRDGNVLLPQMPPVPAVGRSFGEFRPAMEDVVKKSLGNVDPYVSLGAVHQISVLMSGAVARPGNHRLPAFATLVQAIDGQLGPDASFRGIVITHQGKQRSIDLYELLTSDHSTQDLSLSDGDQVFVPLLKATVAIAGQVIRPAIYEIPESGITAAELIRLAGNYVRPSGNRLVRISLDAAGRDQVTEIAHPETTRLKSSDVLIVQRSENVQVGVVQLEGNVRVPGPRSTSVVHTVGDLLRPDMLNPDPYMPFVAILTIDPITLSRNFAAVNLSTTGPGQQDHPLKSGDTVIVLNKDDIRYLGSSDVQAVLAGRVPPGQGKGLVRTPVATVLAQENKATTSPSGNSTGGATDWATSCPGLQYLATVAGVDRSGRFANAVRGTTLTGDTVIENSLPCPPEFAKYPELLSFVLEHAITVDGEVRQPGIYPIIGSASLAQIAEVAGGITRAADLRNIEVSHFAIDRQTGKSDVRREELALTETDFGRVTLNPGDAVRFNPVFNDRDDGPVLLSGEFRRPGLYDIRRGERLSSLYARAGGLNDAAYPYGAVLSRVRARQAEEEGRQRTIRELQIALSESASTAVGSAASQQAQSAAFAQQAMSTLQSTPALGRVVFEADPTALELHPEEDVVLEPGDRIYMPKRTNSITVVGDVLNPSTQAFRDGLATNDYIQRSGGLLSTADSGRVFVILPNGQAEAAAISFWNFSNVSVPPDSTIVVPRDISSSPWALISDLSTAISQAALTAAALVVIGTK